MAIDRVVPPRGSMPGDRGFLVGRVALVTGAARRIGRTLALALAEQGADLVIHYRESATEAKETAQVIREQGGQVALVSGDLAEVSVAQGLIGTAAVAMGRPVDILVNNASVFTQGTATATSPEEWNLNQAVNLRAPFLLSQALAGQLSADQSGHIINLNDYRALEPGADHFAYTISKVGLHGMTRSLARALAPNIRVNELALGAVLPPDNASDRYVHTLRSQIFTGRFPELAEVVQAMLFLLGNGAVTGQTLCIDGGRHLGPGGQE